LTRQNVRAAHRVVYNKSGTHIASCVTSVGRGTEVHGIPVRGFAAEMVTYYFETDDADEAHYLAAVLNSTAVNKSIKPYQPRGLWGERDITRLPFEVLCIPKHNSADATHRGLAATSRACHRKVRLLARRFGKAAVAKQRHQVRLALASELTEIDALVRQLVHNPGGVPTGAPANGGGASSRLLFAASDE